MWQDKIGLMVDVIGDPRLRIYPAATSDEAMIAVTGESGHVIATVSTDGEKDYLITSLTLRERRKIYLAHHAQTGGLFWRLYYDGEEECWRCRYPGACLSDLVQGPASPIIAYREPIFRYAKPAYIIRADDVLGPVGRWDMHGQRFTQTCSDKVYAKYKEVIALLNPQNDS